MLFLLTDFSGNDSKVDGLVNFEKLRMIAKEIRHVGRMASVNMDPALMFRTRWRNLLMKIEYYTNSRWFTFPVGPVFTA